MIKSGGGILRTCISMAFANVAICMQYNNPFDFAGIMKERIQEVFDGSANISKKVTFRTKPQVLDAEKPSMTLVEEARTMGWVFTMSKWSKYERDYADRGGAEIEDMMIDMVAYRTVYACLRTTDPESAINMMMDAIDTYIRMESDIRNEGE